MAGYERLFDLFKHQTSESYKKKRMAAEAKSLINDTFICPFVIHVEEKFAYGSFVKFHKAETVTEFYTQQRLFEAPRGTTAVSNTHYFRFIFDYEFHRLAIEEGGGRLPSPDVMLQTLEHFLEKLATHYFKDHTLTLNLISDDRTLSEVLAPETEYGSIHVKITFPNSHKLNSTLRELKDNNAHGIEVKIAPARGARMKGIPAYVRELVEIAPTLGEATITFFKALPNKTKTTFKRMVYSTAHHPLWLALRQKGKEPESDFIKRVWMITKSRAQNETE